MAIIANHNFLLSGQIASGTGNVIDSRNGTNFAYVEYASYSPSAVLTLFASKDGGTARLPILTVTATPNSGTALISAYYPYVVASYVTGWSTTASANLWFGAGLRGVRAG